MKAITRYLNLFRSPSPYEIASRELDEARRALLAAQTAQEYATAMVRYNTDRIKRLEGMLLK